MALYPKILELVSTLNTESLGEERKRILHPLRDYIQRKIDDNAGVRINFICTHNSRRSHLAQVWAQTFAHHFHIKGLTCFSGGTEVTSLFSGVVATLQNTGFKVAQLSEGNNPIYGINHAENEHPVMGFSKKFDDPFNPKSSFAAVVTCSQADENCPFMAGAETRILISYADPKEFDDSHLQVEKYRECSLQIATEMFYVFSQIHS